MNAPSNSYEITYVIACYDPKGFSKEERIDTWQKLSKARKQELRIWAYDHMNTSWIREHYDLKK